MAQDSTSTGKRNLEYYSKEQEHHDINQSKKINARKHITDFSSPLSYGCLQTRFDDGVLEIGNRNRINPQEETPRLGLVLNMSTSELNRLELALSQQSHQNGNQVSQGHNGFKACNIPALSLKIGNWEWESKREGDLVAKFYYRTKKLVWEVLYGYLKKKIEIQWSNLSAMNVYTNGNNVSRLEIQLKEHPKLYEEMRLNPKMRTKWENTGNDFTGDQTRICSQHTIVFATQVLDGPFRNLLECDKRLLNLTQQPFPYQNPPLFQQQGTIVPYSPNVDQPIVGHSSYYIQTPVLKSPSRNNLTPDIPFAVIQDKQDDIIPNLEMDLGILDDLDLPELHEMDMTRDIKGAHQDKNIKTDYQDGTVCKENNACLPVEARIGTDDGSIEVKNPLAYVDGEIFSVCDPFPFPEPNYWLYPEFNTHEFTNGGYNDVNQIGFDVDDELFVFQNSDI